jgi:hypothetical protein
MTFNEEPPLCIEMCFGRATAASVRELATNMMHACYCLYAAGDVRS